MKNGENRDELKNISVDNGLEDSSVDNELIEDNDLTTEKNNDQVIDQDTEIYNFGWSSYSEKTNGRFAMIGFLSIILIELFSKQSFLKWAGIL